MEDKCKTGRVTIPTDLDVVPETLEILKKWGADAIRDLSLIHILGAGTVEVVVRAGNMEIMVALQIVGQETDAAFQCHELRTPGKTLFFSCLHGGASSGTVSYTHLRPFSCSTSSAAKAGTATAHTSMAAARAPTNTFFNLIVTHL